MTFNFIDFFTYVGHGTTAAAQIKEFTIKYFEDRMAGWIVRQGGWVSALKIPRHNHNYEECIGRFKFYFAFFSFFRNLLWRIQALSWTENQHVFTYEQFTYRYC